MKLVWSPETASKAYMDTVKSASVQESSVAELVSAMAAGWNTKLIVETWFSGRPIATSIGLAVAGRHTGGRHVCVVPDEKSGFEYTEAMKKAGELPEVVVGKAEEVVVGLDGVDFLVVDCRKGDFWTIFEAAKLGGRGAVLVCKNANSRSSSEFHWCGVGGGGWRVVRSVFLPVGQGLSIAHIGSGGEGKAERRWIKHVNRHTGEMTVIRR